MNYKIILILFIIYIILYYWANNIHIHTIDSFIQGPTVLIVGSSHGNEPAGTVCIETLLNTNLKLKKGKIICIPRPNKLGYLLNMRHLPHRINHRDLNRNYPRKNGEIPKESICNKICQLAYNQADFILDLHEGWGFHKINNNSLGSGVYPGDTHRAISLSYRIVDKLNLEINHPNKKFIVGLNNHPELNSLRSFANYIKRDYILVETTGQNNIQPIEIRRDQMLSIIKNLLINLNML
jgi:predicted deacylase